MPLVPTQIGPLSSMCIIHCSRAPATHSISGPCVLSPANWTLSSDAPSESSRQSLGYAGDSFSLPTSCSQLVWSRAPRSPHPSPAVLDGFLQSWRSLAATADIAVLSLFHDQILSATLPLILSWLELRRVLCLGGVTRAVSDANSHSRHANIRGYTSLVETHPVGLWPH